MRAYDEDLVDLVGRGEQEHALNRAIQDLVAKGFAAQFQIVAEHFDFLKPH